MKPEDFETSEVDSEDNVCYSEEDTQGVETKTNNHKRKNEDIPSNNSKSTKKRKNDLDKPVTAEELINLRETENLFNNHLFRLQIDSLLSQMKITSKKKVKLNLWLDTFKSSFGKFPETKILFSDIMDSKKHKKMLLNNIMRHKCLFQTDQDLTIHFLKPENIQQFNLYDYNACPNPTIVNINLIIPKTCFMQKDYLNNRYLVKRYYYLLYVGEYLKKCDLISSLEISFYEDNCLLPVINVVPKDCSKTRITLFATPSTDMFKVSRFLTDKNNVKSDIFNSEMDIEIMKSTPTIFYNSTIAHDVTLHNNNEFLHGIFNDETNLKDALNLICIWLKQRELNIGLGSFTENIAIYFIAYLLCKKKINKLMSSYQIIRNFWNFLSSTDLLKEAIHIGEIAPDVLENFKQLYSIVLIDTTGGYNVASFLLEEIYKKVRLESKIALNYLDDGKTNSFHELFLAKHPFNLQYDAIIDLTQSLPLSNIDDTHLKQRALYIGYTDLLACNIVTKRLQKGLNKRVYHLVPRIELENGILKRFLFGINLNPDNAFHFLEKGPALSEFKAAQKFRDFWSPLATDRRFKDGSAHVAVYFKANTIKTKRGVVKKMLDFLLKNMKFKLHYDQFDDILMFKRLVPSYPSGSNEETCLKIILASDEMGKKLRELQLPLKITGVQGISDIFTYCSVFPPIPENFKVGEEITTVQDKRLIFSIDNKIKNIPRYIEPIENILQLEHSSKWPDELEALRKLKTSFHIQISKLLKQNSQILAFPSPEYLDVLYKGIVFRYKLFVPKEIGLIKREETEDGFTSFKESEESLNAEISLNVLPKIIGGLKGIQSLHPSFGPGTALIKRWLRTHLIDEYHISDTVISLLNASLYLMNSKILNPNTPQISFLRFLKFISTLDWVSNIVIVNFNNQLTNERILEVDTLIQNNRNDHPNLFILTPFDNELSLFTKSSPSKEILVRIKLLANESLAFIDRIITEGNNISIKEIFIPNYAGYNALIYLKPSLNSRSHQQLAFSSVDNRIVIDKYEESKDDVFPIVDFDPLKKYLCCLRQNYGKYAIFFHDSYGGNVIAVLWRPHVFETTDFKVATIGGCKLVNDKMVFNVDGVIEDFYTLGVNLVQSIKLCT